MAEQWRSAGSCASALLASGGNEEEAERVQASGEAAGRRPFQAGQRAARSGQVERVAAMWRQPPGHGRP